MRDRFMGRGMAGRPMPGPRMGPMSLENAPPGYLAGPPMAQRRNRLADFGMMQPGPMQGQMPPQMQPGAMSPQGSMPPNLMQGQMPMQFGSMQGMPPNGNRLAALMMQPTGANPPQNRFAMLGSMRRRAF